MRLPPHSPASGEDAAATAHTLSYLGYLHLLADEPAVTEAYAWEALAIAQDRDNAHETARAFQILGNAAIGCADLVRAAQYHRAAAAGFAAVNDPVGEASALAHLSYRSATLYADWAVPADVSLAVGMADAAHALAVAQAGGTALMETVGHIVLAVAEGAQGMYGPALVHARHAVTSAAARENCQHGLLAHNTLGLLYRDLLALPHALWHLERALVLARQFGARNAIGDMAAHLISALAEAGETARADALLAELLPPETPMETLVQRRLWLARAERALAGGEPETALHITDDLIATAHNIGDRGDRGIPRISLWRGQALTALGRLAEAEAALTAAAETAAAQGAQPLLWRIHRALGALHHAADDREKATAAFCMAGEIIAALAESVPDERERAIFVREATATIPAPYRRPARPPQKAGNRDAALTARERDVVRHVSRGASNREIAAALFISEKTVEAHLTRILRKLGLHTRASLVTWAAMEHPSP